MRPLPTPSFASRAWPRAACVLCACAAALAGTAARAQDAGGLKFSPTFSVTETLTTNRDLVSANPQADAITTISPGIQISSRAGRVQGSLSFSLNILNYARASQLNSVSFQRQNALDSKFRIDAVENRAYVDVGANISQQTISAFGTQAGGTGLVNANRSEVTTLSVAPTLRGRIADFADYNATLTGSTSSSAGTQLGDSTGYGGQFSLSRNNGTFGWGLNASRQGSSYKAGTTSATDQYSASVNYAPRYDLNLSASLGRARSDVLAGTPAWTQTTGLSVNWQPTERTNVGLQAGKTYYGNSHSYTFTHRMARSVWSYVDTTSASNSTAQTGPLTLYDLLYALCVNGGGNAAGCDQATRTAIAQQGLSPTTVLSAGSLNSTLTVTHSQNLSASYSGLRLTTTLTLFRNSTTALGAVPAGGGDLSQASAVRQQGVTLGLSHRLTESSSLSLTGSQLTTLGSGSQAGTAQRIFNLFWAFSAGARTNVTLAARHTQFTSTTNPYRESALLGTLGYLF